MIRVLHVVGGLKRAGAETWLVNILKQVDRSRFQMDFLVHSRGPDDYDTEIKQLGSRIIRCPDPQRVFGYTRNLKRLLRTNGPYDIVHSHVHKFSGVVLKVSASAGVPIRIAHSHLDTTVWDTRSHALRGFYDSLMRAWINRFATGGCGASPAATRALFGEKWCSDPRWNVLFYGIDLLPFREPYDRVLIRTRMGLPKDALVIGHVGRFSEQKNHDFIVQIAAETIKREPRSYFLLLGDGPLRAKIEERFRSHGIRDQVIFGGVRDDVASLMLGAMDAFLFPSLTEGLPLALLEAQAAGLPCVISNVIAKESDAVPRLINRLSLDDCVSQWVDCLLNVSRRQSLLSRKQALETVEDGPYNIRNSVRSLETQYLAFAAR
jgi:glycosyltransferase involved in cell wall biosynthesis